MTNANRETIIKCIDSFRVTAAHGGIGLIYFTGHGFSIEGHDYILPVDDAAITTAADVQKWAVDVTSLLAPIDSFIEEHPKDNGSIVMYSTSANCMAFEGPPDDELELFAGSFVQALSSNHNSLAEFAHEVRELTEEKTRDPTGTQRWLPQMPELKSLSDAEFSFSDRTSDERIGILKIIVIDTCRVNPDRFR